MKIELMVEIAILLTSTLSQAEDPPAKLEFVTPFVLQPIEDKYAKSEADVAKLRKVAAAARLKSYKDHLAEVTKKGDFDKAVAIKARIEQLEKDPEVEAVAPPRRTRPKDVTKFQGHSYYWIKDAATWHIAKQRCEEMGGHLVCIETAAEESFIKQLCGNSPTWVGGSDEETEGNWVWCYKGTPVKLAMKLDNAGSADHHLALFAGEWYDGHAGTRYSYVCEVEN